MLDFGFDEIAVIGAVALVVIGPQKLPRVARTVGALLGKAQRYVSDVKAEVNRSIELEELQKMKSHVETAARDMTQTVHREMGAAGQAMSQAWTGDEVGVGLSAPTDSTAYSSGYTPSYKPPKKNWRAKRGAVPLWFKQRQGVRMHAQSGAARVARFRPRKIT